MHRSSTVILSRPKGSKVLRAIAAAVLLAGSGCISVEQEPYKASVERLVASGGLAETVRQLAMPIIESGRNIGMVIAVSTPLGEGVYSFGAKDPAGKEPMTDDAVFQVGSVSKAFAAILTAQLAHEHRIKIDEPVGRLLPESFGPASPALRNMTFAELASHTSGMPHEAYSQELFWGLLTYLVNGKNLYRYENTTLLQEYLQSWRFAPATKKDYAYSNLGIVYLGWLLGQIDHKGYASLLQEKVITPLGLKHTGLCLTTNPHLDLTPGYAGDLPTFVSRHSRVDPWLFDEGIAASGGVYSTAGDLLSFAKANIGLTPSTLAAAMNTTHLPRAPAEGGWIGLSWFLKTLPATGQSYTYIAGIVGGHTSFVGFDERHKVAVVVLENSINHDDLIGVTLLDRLVGAELVRENPPPSAPIARLPDDQYSK